MEKERAQNAPVADGKWGLAVHGGAGEISDKKSIPDRTRQFDAIVRHGREMLSKGASAMDVVEQVVMLLEDCPYFNAGRGSVFTHTGTHEMDASIMDGTKLSAGAVGNVGNVRNPISLARAVAEGTSHVLMVGLGAESLAPKHGIPREDTAYFFTRERYDQLLTARATNSVVLDHGGSLIQDEKSISNADPLHLPHISFMNDPLEYPRTPVMVSPPKSSSPPEPDLKWAAEHKFSTVGCVARDMNGNLAAAGSTGGLCNKQPGRVGDTPLVGAGVYSNSSTCAVACTGQGETFIKNVVAYDIHARVKYQGVPLKQAVDEVILSSLPPGTGGCIAIDKRGKPVATYNTHGMFAGLADSTGLFEVWHRTEMLWQQGLERAAIVPDVLDVFAVSGNLSVWFPAKLGAVSILRVAVVGGNALKTTTTANEPTVFFTGAPARDAPVSYHTLLMVCPDSPCNAKRTGSERAHWLIANIPDQKVHQGQVLLPYVPPQEHPEGAARYVFLVLLQKRALSIAEVDTAISLVLDEAFTTRGFISAMDITPLMCNFFVTATPSAETCAKTPVVAEM